MTIKKLLIITYYWPPSGGIGVLRCLKYAKYLSKLGWEITVFTVKNGQYPYIDHSNDKDIPDNIKVIRSNIWEPYNIYKLISGKKKTENVNNVFSTSNSKRGFIYNFSVWIRSNFFIPDARAIWVKPSVKYLEKYLAENEIDAILSNGPPHSNTRIACLLKKKFPRIHWHADFQDPWSQVDYFAQLKLTSWGHKKHIEMEQEVFQYADSISIVSPSWKTDLESIGAKNVKVLEWGFDIDDYKSIDRVPDQKFTIAHIGIMGFDRNPIMFFQAVKELIDENEYFSNNFELKLIGEVDLTVRNEIQKFGLEPWVNYKGSVSRNIAIQETLNSQVLLLLLNQQPNAKGRIPGKLFEYLAVSRPILVLGPEFCDSGKIVESSMSGINLNYNNKYEIKKYLLEMFNNFVKSGDLSIDQNNIYQYDIKNITRKLDVILRKNINNELS